MNILNLITLGVLMLASGLATAAAPAFLYRVYSPGAAPAPLVNCVTPWGATVAHGQSVTAYLTASVVGGTCQPENRPCNNGLLAGTYANSACAVVADVADFGGYRGWSDGTYATACNGYRNPASNSYTGATGDGLYKISVSGTPVTVYCDMTTDEGGWTLILKAAPGSNGHANAAAVGTLTSPTQSGVAKLSDAVVNVVPKSMYRMSNSAQTASVYFDTSDSFSTIRQVANKASTTYLSPVWKGPFYDTMHRGFNTYQPGGGNFGVGSALGGTFTGASSGDSCRLGIGITGGGAGWCGAGDAGTVWLK